MSNILNQLTVSGLKLFYPNDFTENDIVDMKYYELAKLERQNFELLNAKEKYFREQFERRFNILEECKKSKEKLLIFDLVVDEYNQYRINLVKENLELKFNRKELIKEKQEQSKKLRIQREEIEKKEKLEKEKLEKEKLEKEKLEKEKLEKEKLEKEKLEKETYMNELDKKNEKLEREKQVEQKMSKEEFNVKFDILMKKFDLESIGELLDEYNSINNIEQNLDEDIGYGSTTGYIFDEKPKDFDTKYPELKGKYFMNCKVSGITINLNKVICNLIRNNKLSEIEKQMLLNGKDIRNLGGGQTKRQIELTLNGVNLDGNRLFNSYLKN
jgi:hypothetical protein